MGVFFTIVPQSLRGKIKKTPETLRLKDKHVVNFVEKFVMGIHTMKRAITHTACQVTYNTSRQWR